MPSLADLLGITTPDANPASSSMYQPPSLMNLIQDPSNPLKSKIVWNAPQAPIAPTAPPAQMSLVPQTPASAPANVSSNGGGDPNSPTSSQSSLAQLLTGLSLNIPGIGPVNISMPNISSGGLQTGNFYTQIPNGTVSVNEDPAQIAAILAGGGGSGSGGSGGGSQFAPGSNFSQISVSPAQQVPGGAPGDIGQVQGSSNPSSYGLGDLAQFLGGLAAGAIVPGGGSILNAAVAGAPGISQALSGDQSLTQQPSSNSWLQTLLSAPSALGGLAANGVSDLTGTGNTDYGQGASAMTGPTSTNGYDPGFLTSLYNQMFGPSGQSGGIGGMFGSIGGLGFGGNQFGLGGDAVSQVSDPSNSANNFGIFGGSIDQGNPWGGGFMSLLLPGQGGV